MPRKYAIRRLKTTELTLDTKNPRFVSFDASNQDTIINYLLRNEGVIELARSINAYGGLLPGEFPIVCNEEEQSVVIEGNRRVCSCKILLDPNLAPAEFRASIPPISKETRSSIKRIDVHVIESREEAQVILGTRHIQGIKRWPSIAKFSFFAQHFNAGKTINDISELTGVTPSTITKSLKKHYFLQYILSLDCWSELEKQNRVNYTQLHKTGVDRILRIFNTEGSSELKLSYDETYNPISELPNFGKIVEHIVRRVLNILPEKTEITTRTKFSEIREDIKEFLPEEEKTQKATEQQQVTTETPPKTDSGPSSPVERSQTRRTPPLYFEDLEYNLDQSNKDDQPLLVICEEIIKLSRTGGYRLYPLSTSYLTRALIEQTLKRHLRIHDYDNYQRLYPQNGDSSLKKTLCHYCETSTLFDNNQYRRLFDGLFHNGGGIKNIMDLNVHYPDLSIPTPSVLQGWVSQGLKNVIEYLLK